MLSRLKKLNPEISASGIALVIAIFSVFIAIGSDNAPCLSANATCTVGQNPEFTNDISVKSGTIYNATIGHNLSANATYSLVQPGYNHTGNLAVIDSANDLNVGGAVILGSSLTSTLGAIRFDSNAVQVYDSTGAWVGVGGADQNVFTTINGNSGNLTASTTNTSIKLQASADSGLTVVASGDKLEIQSTGGGGYDPKCAYYAYLGSNYTPSNPNGLALDSELYDFDNCFTISSSSSGSTITYNDSTTRVFNVSYLIQININSTNGAYYSSALAVGRNQPGSPTNFAQHFQQKNGTPIALESISANTVICLENAKEFSLEFPVWTNGVVITGGRQYTNIIFNELPELSTKAQSNGCTNGLID